jgi:hypothetical protein
MVKHKSELRTSADWKEYAFHCLKQAAKAEVRKYASTADHFREKAAIAFRVAASPYTPST